MKINRIGFSKIYTTKTHMRTTYKYTRGLAAPNSGQPSNLLLEDLRKSKKYPAYNITSSFRT